MSDLKKILQQARSNGTAVAHFNVADLVMLNAIEASARELHVPVIVGVSEGERDFIGVRQIAALVRSLREEHGLPIFLNADHTHSLAKAVEAAHAGFDAVAFDASAQPLDRNAISTREAVETLKAINPALLVEGEIGDIGTGSQIHESAPDVSAGLTTPEEARQFVEATGVDILAPAVGNRHGMVRSMLESGARTHLDIARIEAIKAAAPVFLTLHGGSGTDDRDLSAAIAAGMEIIHINTELRVAWRRGLEDGLARLPDDVVPYRVLPFAVASVREVVMQRLRLMNRKP
jgi:fructose-bisphosphate aldolase class II